MTEFDFVEYSYSQYKNFNECFCLNGKELELMLKYLYQNTNQKEFTVENFSGGFVIKKIGHK